MSEGTIVHSHGFNCGGMGDFLRSVISFSILCRQHDVNFRINLDQNPLFRECFSISKQHEGTLSGDVEYRKNIDGLIGNSGEEFILDVISQARNSSIPQVVLSNCAILGAYSVIRSGIDALDNFFGPSELTRSKIECLYQKHHLLPGAYTSFHLRCGDRFMDHRFSLRRIKGISKDDRVGSFDDAIKKYTDLLLNLAEASNKDSILLVHSDSIDFKIKVKKKLKRNSYRDRFIFFDIEPQHTHSEHGEHTVESFSDTVAEFYVMAAAGAIYMPVYSGFSHLAAVLGDVQLYGPETTKKWQEEFMFNFGLSNLSEI